MTSSVTGLYPWLGYQATDQISLWGVTGYGKGRLDVDAGRGRGTHERAVDGHGGGDLHVELGGADTGVLGRAALGW